PCTFSKLIMNFHRHHTRGKSVIFAIPIFTMLVVVLFLRRAKSFQYMRAVCLLLFFAVISFSATSQTLESITRLQQDTTRKDSLRRETPSSVPAGNEQLTAPRNFYNLMRNRQVHRKGLFSVHKVADNYYFEIPDSILGRDLLVVARIAQGAAGLRPGQTGFAGDQARKSVV